MKYPSMWISEPGMSVLSSMAGMIVNSGCASAAFNASDNPSVESWSLIAMFLRPRDAHRSTSRVGVNVPSENVV